MAAKKIALFIDADNISAKFGKQIINALESRGEIFIRRIYGNWEKPSLHGWNDCIREFALRAVQQTDFVTGKNATDMSLTIDAMDVLHRDNAEIFALVTNDSDFTPLVIRLREGGMKIIGIGNATASNAFRDACTEFIDLGTLAEVKPVKTPPVTKKFSPAPVKPVAPVKSPVVKKSAVQLSLFDDFNVEHEPPPVTANPKVISLEERKLQSERDKNIQLMHDALQDSAAVHANAEGFSSLNYARQYVRSKNFNFTVRDFGYGQLKDFIAAYPKLYETRDNGQNFFYRCRTNDEPAPLAESDRLNRLHEVLREAVATHADSAGFADLCYVGGYIAKQNLGFDVKSLGYGSLQKFLATFANMYELRTADNKSFMRCRERLEQFHKTLREAVAIHADNTGFADLRTVKGYITDQNLGFDVKSLGYGSLQKFLTTFANMYELRTADNKSFMRCREDDANIPDDALDQLHNAMREAVTANADDAGFANLCAVGNFIIKKNIGSYVNGLGYGTLQKFIAAFPALYELQADKVRCRTNEPKDELEQLHEVLRETAALHEDSDGFVNLWWACDFISGKKNLVKEIKSMTYKDLIEFLNDFPDRYEIRQEPGQDLCYRCRAIKPKPAENNRLQQLHKILRETAQGNRDKNGFVDLTCAGQNMHDKNFTIKGLGYGSLSKFVSAFPKLYEMRTVGKIVRYRCRQSQK